MRVVIIGLVLLLPHSLFAKDFDVGGSNVKIPDPEGFALVTMEMAPLYNIAMKMPDPANDTISFYINHELIGSAMAGEIPAYERYMMVKVFREFRNKEISGSDFLALSQAVISNNDAAFENIAKQLPKLMKKGSELVESELNVDFAMEMAQMVPLPVHHQDSKTFAYSMYQKWALSSDGKAVAPVILSATATFVLVRNRLLFFYVYGKKDDLDWTRKTSAKWVSHVTEANQSAVFQNNGTDVDWGRIAEKGVGGALGALVLSILFVGYSKVASKSGEKR